MKEAKAETSPTPGHPLAPWIGIVALATFFLLTWGLQLRNGAFSNDFGGHPDEAAHVVTGLMVRDYIAGPLWHGEHPLRFAESYYENFPKVALGHYPPGFYVVEGLWLVPFRSKAAILLLMTTLTSITAFIIWLVGRRFLLPANAFLAATTFLLIPLVQTYTAIVMSDMLLLICCLLATLSFGQFMHSGKIRWSLLFGLLATAAILTKGSGLLLVLVPPFAILFTRQFRLLANWRLWLAPIPVILFALPWMLATRHITDEGMQHVPLTEYIPAALVYYAQAIPGTFGFLLSLLLLLSLFLLKKRTDILPALLLALLCSSLVLYVIVPAGLDTRYLLTASASILLLSFTSLQWLTGLVIKKFIAGKCATSTPSAITSILIPIMICALIILENRPPNKKAFTASHPTLESINAAPSQIQGPGKNDRRIVLVSSDARGEGALVAEGCLFWPDTLSFRRASKVLSQSDWLGRGYSTTYTTASQLNAYLAANIQFVVVDTGIPGYQIQAHHRLLQSTLLQSQSATRLASIPSRRNSSALAQFISYQILPSLDH